MRKRVAVGVVAAIVGISACGGGGEDGGDATAAPSTAGENSSAATAVVSPTTTSSGAAASPSTTASAGSADSVVGGPETAGPASLIDATPVALHPVTLPGGTRHSSEMNAGGTGLWVGFRGDESDSGLVQIDSRTGEVLRTVAIARPWRVAVTEAAAWVDADDVVVRVDAATGEAIEVDARAPVAWGDQLWVWTPDPDGGADQGTRLDPGTLEQLARASVARELLVELFPDQELPDTVPLRVDAVGPDAVWSVWEQLGVTEIDPETGAALRITPAGDYEFGDGMNTAAVPGGIWVVAENDETDDDVLLRVDTGQVGYTVETVLAEGLNKYSVLAADETFVYVLGQEGPLAVYDAATGELLTIIEHPEFVDNAYTIALASGSVWVTAQNDVLLQFAP